MAWRGWSFVAVLVLANYIVLSIVGNVFFPPTPVTAPTHIAQPTFTPGIIDLKQVGPLSYSFLTPTATDTPSPTVAATLKP